MSQPWSPEVEISAELALSLIGEQFPQLKATQIELLGDGWDSSAFLVDKTFVFRFPRRQLGAACLENETRVLPELVSRLPLPIPNPEYVGHPTERFPWIFAGYRRLEGQTACAMRMDDAQRIATAPALATFLAVLHSLPVEWGRQIGIPEEMLGRLDPVRRVPQARERVENLVKHRFITDSRSYHSIIDETATARPAQASSVVHGDLYVRHILVDEDSRPCGVIDWGDIHIGDIALDLSIAHSFLPPAGRDEFRRAYGPIDDATWRLSRFRALSYGLILTEYGDSVGEVDLQREGALILTHVLDG